MLSTTWSHITKFSIKPLLTNNTRNINTCTMGIRFVVSAFALLLTALLCFARADDPCLKNCVLDADCGLGAACDRTCYFKPNYCSAERWSVNDRGETTNCNAYICHEPTGLCRRNAESPIHCTHGFVFDGKSACVPSIQCDPSGNPSCQKLLDQWKAARENYELRTPQPKPNPLTCRACLNHSQCAGAEMCWSNICMRSASFCRLAATGDWSSDTKDGSSKSCGSYACDRSQGTCFESCMTVLDCREGAICNQGSCQH